jgi:hypothetical protein
MVKDFRIHRCAGWVLYGEDDGGHLEVAAVRMVQEKPLVSSFSLRPEILTRLVHNRITAVAVAIAAWV